MVGLSVCLLVAALVIAATRHSEQPAARPGLLERRPDDSGLARWGPAPHE